jgi:ribonuclease E
LPEDLQQIKQQVSIPAEAAGGTATEAQESPDQSQPAKSEQPADNTQAAKMESIQRSAPVENLSEKHLEPVAEDKAAVESAAKPETPVSDSVAISTETSPEEKSLESAERPSVPEPNDMQSPPQEEEIAPIADIAAEDTAQEEKTEEAAPLVLELPLSRQETVAKRAPEVIVTPEASTPEVTDTQVAMEDTQATEIKAEETTKAEEPTEAVTPTEEIDQTDSDATPEVTAASSEDTSPAEPNEQPETTDTAQLAVSANEVIESAGQTAAGSSRASNDPRLKPSPVTELKVVTETPAIGFSDALDTSLPSPITITPSTLQRPANDPRLARRIQKEGSQQDLLQESAAENS